MAYSIITFLKGLLGANGGLKVVSTSPELVTATVTIADTESLSDAADLSALGVPIAIITDAAWDTNAVTFQGSADGVTFSDLRATGVEVSIAGVVASSMEPLDPRQFLACQHLKVRSGTAGAAVAQAGDTVVTIVCRPI